MHRCFIEPSNWANDAISLPRDESHHLLHVLRAGKGDTVALFDGTGNEAQARIAGVRNEQVMLDILTASKADRPQTTLALIQALPKGRKMELIIEKATELGVTEITPVITDRTITRLNTRQRKTRSGRWLRLAKSAAKQCGTPWIPRINPVAAYADALSEYGSFDALLVGTLEPDTVPMVEAIKILKARSPKSIAFLVGPEGDLTPDEIQAARASGGIPVTFGKLVLRVETAAIYAISVLNYEFANTIP